MSASESNSEDNQFQDLYKDNINKANTEDNESLTIKIPLDNYDLCK